MRFPKHGTEQSKVKPKVQKLLNEWEWFWWSVPASPYSVSGISDMMAVRPGVFMVIETKYDGNEPTKRQAGFLNSVRTCQHFAFKVDEKNLDAFEVFLRRFDEAARLQAQGITPDADVGGPLLDAIKVLTDYPGSL